MNGAVIFQGSIGLNWNDGKGHRRVLLVVGYSPGISPNKDSAQVEILTLAHVDSFEQGPLMNQHG